MAMTAAVDGAKFDLRQALALNRNLMTLAAQLPGVERRAITTLARRLPVEARRDILSEYNIGKKRLMDDIQVMQTGSGLRLIGFWRGIGLMRFGGKQVSTGVAYTSVKGRTSVRVGAFVVGLRQGTKPKGNVHAARRVGRARLPLKTEYGPTAAQMLRKEDRPARLADFALGLLGREMERLVAVALKETSTSTTAE